MSYPPRPPLVPYGIATGVVTMPMATHVMVGAYGGGGVRGALLPAPGKAVISRPPTRNNGAKDADGPPVTVFIGNITSRAPDAMIRALLGACGPVLSWKRVSTFGFCEFAGPEAALRCVRLLHDRQLADKRLLARTDGKMQALVDTYKTEQRSRLGQEEGAPGTEGGAEGGYLDARQRHADEAATRRLQQIIADYQDDINNYETLQKEEAISKTARVLEEADISEEKRDVIHREIGKFRESMKVPRRRRGDDDRRRWRSSCDGSESPSATRTGTRSATRTGRRTETRRGRRTERGSATGRGTRIGSARRGKTESANGRGRGRENETRRGRGSEIRTDAGAALLGAKSDVMTATRNARGREKRESGTENGSANGRKKERGKYARESENGSYARGSEKGNERTAKGNVNASANVSANASAIVSGNATGSVSANASVIATANVTASANVRDRAGADEAAARRMRGGRRRWKRRRGRRSDLRRRRARKRPHTRRDCATGKVASGARRKSTRRRKRGSDAARRSASERRRGSRSSSRITTTRGMITSTTRGRSCSGG